VFCAAVVRAVHKWGKLLRIAVAHAQNDHRLGANEAPPAIISVFLGEQLTDIFEQLEQGGVKTPQQSDTLTVGVDTLPPLPKDAGDRNRTSPFAFTGNKFEFRAVGSSQSVSGPLVVLNTMMAESLDYMATELEKATGGKNDPAVLNAAVQKLLQKTIKEHKAIIFNGDNYTKEWHDEAERRGLPNYRNTVDALVHLLDKDVAELFTKYQVLSEREVHSRYEIYVERYVKDINTESLLALSMAKQLILPAGYRYQGELASVAAAMKQAGRNPDVGSLDCITTLVNQIEKRIADLETAINHPDSGDVLAHAKHHRDTVIPAMNDLRKASDDLETVISDDLWPLPTYREILFIK
jgi:glutamine synthetase